MRVLEILVATGKSCHVYFNNTKAKFSCRRIYGAFSIAGNRNVIHYGASWYNITDSWRKINGFLGGTIPMCGWDQADEIHFLLPSQ